MADDERTRMFIKKQAMELLPRVEAIIFDVDGVVVDVSGTFRVVICEATQFYCERFLNFEPTGKLLLIPEVELFKNAGGFNNDWDLANAVALLYIYKSLVHETKKPQRLRELTPTLEQYTEEIHRRGGGLPQAEEYLLHQLRPELRRELSLQWNQKLITQIFQEMYAGDTYCRQLYGFDPEHFHGPGRVDQERILLDYQLLPARLKYGLVTGRTLEEARVAIARSHLVEAIPESHWVTHDDGVQKPDGRVMWMAVDRMRFRLGIYIGDTLDDLRTVKNYRELRGSDRARIISAQVLSGPAGAVNRPRFLESGAEIVAPDANALVTFLKSVGEENS